MQHRMRPNRRSTRHETLPHDQSYENNTRNNIRTQRRPHMRARQSKQSYKRLPRAATTALRQTRPRHEQIHHLSPEDRHPATQAPAKRTHRARHRPRALHRMQLSQRHHIRDCTTTNNEQDNSTSEHLHLLSNMQSYIQQTSQLSLLHPQRTTPITTNYQLRLKALHQRILRLWSRNIRRQITTRGDHTRPPPIRPEINEAPHLR